MDFEVIFTPEQVKIIVEEKKELKLTLSQSEAEFLWAIIAHRHITLDLGYNGMSPAFFRILNDFLDDPQDDQMTGKFSELSRAERKRSAVYTTVLNHK